MKSILFILFLSQSGGIWNQELQLQGVSEGMVLGNSLAGLGDLDKDGIPDFIVGAWGAEPNGLFRAGSAFVFSGKNASILFQIDGDQPLKELGYVVASVGDVNKDGYPDFGIGLPGVYFAGEVHIYSGLDGTLIYQWVGATVGDRFGATLDGNQDLNADGYPDIITSALLADPNGIQSAGIVYAYSGNDGSLMYAINGTFPNAYFGGAVSGLADVDGDSYDDFAFSSWYAGSRGSVHIYSGNSGLELWRADGTDSGDVLGTSIDGIEDVNRDGLADVIVGATQSGGLSWPPGYALVLSGFDGSQIFRLNGESSGDEFGRTVAAVGDVNGDGTLDFSVGAPFGHHPISGLPGLVYVYSGVDASLVHQFVGDSTDDCQGFAIANLGDINLDGRPEIGIGDTCTDVSGFRCAGAAYVYSYDPFLTPSGTSISDTTGGSVTYEHHFPLSEAGMNYWLLASTAREGTFIKNGVEIPLANTGLLHRSANNPMPFVQNAVGILDQNAQATSVLTWAPGKANAYVGRTFALASVTYDSSGQIRLSSGKALLRVLP